MTILHPTRTLLTLTPQYVSHFSCIGPRCEDSCCAGWTVAIDKKTFNAYRKATHPDLKPLLAQNMKRTRSANSDVNYAKIALAGESKTCPMTQDSLCAIHSKLNETFLSDTCYAYPRTTRQFAGAVEQGLSLSCPEAARLALLSPDAFEFTEIKLALRESTIKQTVPMHGLRVETMNEIRIFCFQLMRTDGLALWQKLAMLGVFCEQLTTLIRTHQQQAIPALMNDIISALESGALAETLQVLPADYETQALVFASFWDARSGQETSPSQVRVIAMVLKAMRNADDSTRTPEEQVIDGYQRGITRLPQALEQAPYLLEHYVLNELFNNLFPFGDATPYDNYLRLISRFGMVRFLLAAQCNAQEQLPSLDDLVQTVQVFCRRIQHDPHFAAQTNEALRNSNWHRLEKIYSFLRF